MTADEDWSFEAWEAPYPTRTLTVRNPSETPVTLSVNAGTAPWLKLNGATGPLTLNLAGAGSPDDSATVILSIETNADMDVPPGTTGHAVVTIDAANNICLAREPEEITVNFTNGAQTFTAVNTAETVIPHSPDGVSYGAAKDFEFDLSAFGGDLVADIDISISFVNSVGVLGGRQADEQMRIALLSPNQPPNVKERKLWNGNDAPEAYFSNGPFQQDIMTLDSPSLPPLGGAQFSAYAGEDMGGLWTLRLYSKSQTDIIPYVATLRLTRQ